jgi:hypothetical protein
MGVASEIAGAAYLGRLTLEGTWVFAGFVNLDVSNTFEDFLTNIALRHYRFPFQFGPKRAIEPVHLFIKLFL